MDQRRLVVVWRVTERCDTACAFCAYDVRLRRPRRELNEPEAMRFGGLLASWAGAARRDVLLAWLGGEPLLWPPLQRVTYALRARGLRLALTTNGRALADPRWRRFAFQALDELTVSLDGPPAIHDRLRLRPGLGATVLGALSELRALRGGAVRPLLRVNTVLMRDNVEHFEELAALVAKAGADELTFNGLGGRDRPEFFPAQRLRPVDVTTLTMALEAARGGAARHGMRIQASVPYLARLAASASLQPMPVVDCGPGQGFWFVEVDGQLAPCSFTTESAAVPIGELRTEADLSRLPARLAEARARSRAACCDDCPSTQVHQKFADAAL